MRGRLFTVLFLSQSVFGDEGMWLFNKPPREYLKKHYGFTPTEEWLEHVQKSSVRFNTGGSGSFVSPDGLVMTNHHVGAASCKRSATRSTTTIRDGFHARLRPRKSRATTWKSTSSSSIEDVTKRVKAAVKPDMKPAEAFAARRAVMAEIEKESLDKNRPAQRRVTLYQGGEYNLYRYKKYTDIRLVFAPEQQIAFYGGDRTISSIPLRSRHCFFRVYENGKPAKIEQLSEMEQGRREGRRIGVRLRPSRPHQSPGYAWPNWSTCAIRGYPFLLQRLNRREVLLETFSGRQRGERSQAEKTLFGVQNSRKARIGGLAGLLDPQSWPARKSKRRSCARPSTTTAQGQLAQPLGAHRQGA